MRVPAAGLRAGRMTLPREAAQYVARVLRRGEGDLLTLFDGSLGIEAGARIVSVGEAGVVVEVGPPGAAQIPGGREITLVQALGKGDKMDAIVRDATELGATRIVPVETRRAVARAGGRGEAKVARWRAIAIEAARQSGRGDTPEVTAIGSLESAGREVLAGARLVLVPAAVEPAGARLQAALREGLSIAIVVGPEGGLDEAEILSLAEAGWSPVSLGPRVLRTETVAAAVLGALLVLGVAWGEGSS